MEARNSIVSSHQPRTYLNDADVLTEAEGDVLRKRFFAGGIAYTINRILMA
jgi:hypothetical protein